MEPSSDSVTPTVEKILVVCRAIPEESAKYFRTVCVAGITNNLELRRLYPIPFKPFKKRAGIPFGKKDWIEIPTAPPEDKRDTRIESRKVYLEDVKLVGKASDEEVYKYIKQIKRPSLKSIEESRASLGIIKPKVIDYEVVIHDTELKDEQHLLAIDGSVAPTGKIKLGQNSYYVYSCEETEGCTCANRPHKMKIQDWEVNELYRNIIRRNKDENEIREKMRYSSSLENMDDRIIIVS